MDARSDTQLVEACALGDSKSWAELVERYTRLVYSVPRQYGLASSDCDDVHQAVFSALVSQLGKLRSIQALPAWLMTTAHRETWRISRTRGKAVDADWDFADPQEPRSEVVQSLETRQLVRTGLERLGGKCKDLLLRLFGAGPEPDYKEIATSLDMPIGSIGPTRARCLSKLEAILRTLGVSSEE